MGGKDDGKNSVTEDQDDMAEYLRLVEMAEAHYHEQKKRRKVDDDEKDSSSSSVK